MHIQKFTVLTLPNLIKTLKGLCYLLAALCGISVIFTGLLLLINLPVFDEALHADLAEPPRNEAMPPVDNNAYYALMGLRAAPGKDPVAAGQALVLRYLDNRATGMDMLANEDYEEILGAKQLDAGIPLKISCNEPKVQCSVEQLSSIMREGGYDQAQMALLLQRYDALLAMTTLRYLGNATSFTPAPSFQTSLDAQKYKLVERYNTGSALAFLKQVADDLQFWKRLLREGPWLIDKMIAISALWTDMRMLSEYMAGHELSVEDRALINVFLIPLNAEELDIGEAFLTEAHDLQRMLANLHTHPQSPQHILSNAFQLQLTLTNATTNRQYTSTLKPLVELSRLSAAGYVRTISTTEYRAMETAQRKLGVSPANLYNLGGKVFLANQRWQSGETYIGRIHDINAMLLAVRLQFELKGTAREQLAESIRNSSITQPYTGEAFTYNAEEARLTFECRDKWSQNTLRCTVKL